MAPSPPGSSLILVSVLGAQGEGGFDLEYEDRRMGRAILMQRCNPLGRGKCIP